MDNFFFTFILTEFRMGDFSNIAIYNFHTKIFRGLVIIFAFHLQCTPSMINVKGLQVIYFLRILGLREGWETNTISCFLVQRLLPANIPLEKQQKEHPL